MDFQAIRKEYEDSGIDADASNDCPIKQLELWLEEATEKSPGRWFETNAMALATAGMDGRVSVRQVLLKGITTGGVRFFTNYDSAKGQQLAENPSCSAALHWPHLGRQVRISGKAEKTSRKVSEDYFHSRPRRAQLSATISSQSAIIESHNQLQNRLDELEAELSGQPVPLPQNWGGYLIRPTEFEFWQGRTNRLHDRVVYRGSTDDWQKFLLSP